MFISMYNCKCKGLQGGTLCGPVFCILKHGCFFFLVLCVEVCFVCAFENHSITMQNRSTTIQKVIISSELVFWINTKSQLATLWCSIGKSNNFGIFLKIICSYCKCPTIILHMPSKHVIFYNLELIRANWDLVWVEKSTSGFFLQLLHALYYCPSNITWWYLYTLHLR